MPDPTETKPANHKLSLPNLSAKILADLLQSAGWTRNVSDVVLAGGIINSERIPERVPESLYETPDNTKPDQKYLSQAKLTAWGDTLVEFELTEKERDMAKYVIDHFAKNGKIPPNKYAYKLLVEFKLHE